MPQFHPLLPSLPVIALIGGLCTAVIWLTGQLTINSSRLKWISRLCLAALILGGIMILNIGFSLHIRGGRNAKLAILVDTSASMGIKDMPDGQSRLEAAVIAARQIHKHTGKGWTKHCFLFNMDIRPADPSTLDRAAKPAGTTDLAHALDTLQENLGPDVTVVVISDGITPGLVNPPPGLELYSVSTGTDCATFPNLSIGEIRAPEMIRSGDGCDIAIPVDLHGFPDTKELTLSVTLDGRHAAELHQPVSQGGQALFTCRTDFKDPGIHTITFTMPNLPGEVTYLDNQQTLALEVRDDRRCTLLCFPVLNTAFRPIQRMLGGKDAIALYRLNNNSVWQIVASEGQGGLFKDGFPESAEKLQEIDLLILGSTRAADYSQQERAILAQYTENGGTLIVLAGSDGAFEASGDTAWEALMPASQADCILRTGNFEIIPPPDATSPLAELARQANAITSVNAVEHLKDGVTSLLDLRGEHNYPLLLSMPYGKGRVFALMVNPIQSWGGSAERSAAFRRFWTQLLAEADDGRNEHLKVSLSSTVIRTGQRIDVTVTPPDTTYSVQALFRPDGTNSALPVTLHGNSQGSSGKLSTLKYNQGVLEVQAHAQDRRQYRRFLKLDCPEKIAEYPEIRTRPENFLKYTLPGRLHTLDSLAALADELDQRLTQDTAGKEYRPVFETPYFLAALLSLLLVQWFLRRRAGLF